MIEIKPPLKFNKEKGPFLFLGGGITGTSNWQESFVKQVKNCDITIFNPRQEDYQDDIEVAKKQIKWEFDHFKVVEENNGIFFFWFPPETLCPITLFEFGKFIRKENLVIGCNPNYLRKLDLQEQLYNERPELTLNFSLDEMEDNVRKILE